MTQLFAVVEHNRVEAGDDFVRMGGAIEMSAYAQRAEGDVTVYRVKQSPEFVSREDLNPLNKVDVKGKTDSAKKRFEEEAERLGLPKTKEEAKKLMEELKEQGTQEAKQAAATIAATLAILTQSGERDPKKLAEVARQQVMVKANEVKGRFAGLLGQVRGAAEELREEFSGEARKTFDEVTDSLDQPAPQGIVDGQTRYVATSFIMTGKNATKTTVAQLHREAKRAKNAQLRNNGQK